MNISVEDLLIKTLDTIAHNAHCFLISFVVIALIHDYKVNKFAKQKIYELKHPIYTVLTPEVKVEAHLFNITDQVLIDTDFYFIVAPIECSNQPILMVIIVNSHLQHFNRRKFIRDRWGLSNDAVKVFFSVGAEYDYEMMDRIYNEADKYKDIILGNFFDTTDNVTYKHVMGLKWVVHFCTTARYVMTTEDDVFFNYRELIQFIARDISPWGALNLLGCTMAADLTVSRTNKTKWPVPQEMYSSDQYPPYCYGGFILFSKDVVPYLVEASEDIPYLYVHVAYVTGIVPENVGIPRTNIQHAYLYIEDGNRSKIWQETANRQRPFVYGRFNFNQSELEILWELMTASKKL